MKKVRTIKPIAVTLSIFAALFLAGCVSPQSAGRSPKGKLLQDAERYVTELKQHEKLPGYRSTEHGSLIARSAWNGGTLTYPASVTVLARKEGDNSTFCYDLTKNAPESSWRLVKATRLDEHERVIEQMFPK